MAKAGTPRSTSPELKNLSHTVAELFSDRNTEMADMDPQVANKSRKIGEYIIANEVDDFPFRPNPFMGSVVAYDKAASRLSILLSLASAKRVVIELYDEERRFIKRIFDRKVEKGLTEIIRLASGMPRGEFVVVLNCDDGIKSFRISLH
jgi:hypothetical protein